MQLTLWDLALLDRAAGPRQAADAGGAAASPANSVGQFGGTERMVVTTGKRGLSPIYLDRATAEAQPDIRQRRGGSKRLVFGWYGGKFSHLDWLLPLLPAAHHYCEPFAGSAAVLINREPAPVETYNDIDGDVVNFFKVLREDPEGLTQAIALTPFSREEFYVAVNESERNVSRLERARRFYVRARQARTGLAQTATLGRWANCKNTSRAGMSGVISRWFGGIEALGEIGARLLRVQIENRPAIDVIRLYDSPGTLFYCDPPYLHETRGDSKAYGFEMDVEQHREIAHGAEPGRWQGGGVGLSMRSYGSNYTRAGAGSMLMKSSAIPSSSLRQECVWMNY